MLRKGWSAEFSDGSLDLFVKSHLVELWAELHQFQPFSGVPTVLLSGVTRHTGRAFFGSGNGPAFGALKCDNDPDALVLSHEGRSAAVAKRIDKQQSYLLEQIAPANALGCDGCS